MSLSHLVGTSVAQEYRNLLRFIDAKTPIQADAAYSGTAGELCILGLFLSTKCCSVVRV